MGLKSSLQAPEVQLGQIVTPTLDKVLAVSENLPLIQDLADKLADVGDITVPNHNALPNRDVVDAHPISSITGLTEALANAGSNYNDAPLTSRVTALESGKVDKDGTKGLSTLDFTLVYRDFIESIPAMLDGKQPVTTFKTINGISIVGSGDITITGGGGGTTDHSLLTNRNLADAHSTASITGLDAALASKAASVHSHVIADTTGLQAALDSKAGTGVATTSVNGLMSNTDKTKLDGVATGATANSTDAVLKDRANHTGSQAISTITALQAALDSKAGTAVATTSTPGLQSAADKLKLDGIATSATANSTDAVLLNRANHTGSQAISTVTNLQATLDGKAGTSVATTTVNGLQSFTDKVKLDGIATGATANSTDAVLKDRANHTGSQAISTVTNLQATLDAKAAATHSHVIGDTTGLQAALDGKAATSHTHTIAEVTSLQATLDGKQKVITQSGTAPSSPAVGDLWIQV